MSSAAMPSFNQFRIVYIKHLPTSQSETQMKMSPKICQAYLLLRYAEAKTAIHLWNKLQKNLWKIIQQSSDQQDNINLF